MAVINIIPSTSHPAPNVNNNANCLFKESTLGVRNLNYNGQNLSFLTMFNIFQLNLSLVYLQSLKWKPNI